MRNHEIVRRDEGAGTVQYASIVKVVYDGDDEGDFQEFFIGSIEEKPDDVLVASPTSPLGEALLGKVVGDTRRIRGSLGRPKGRDRRTALAMGRTLYEKLWDDHVIGGPEGESDSALH